MKKYIISVLMAMLILALLCDPGYAQRRKLAQTGMKFLSVSTDARISALGEAITSVEGSSAAMLYNPAGMARMQGLTDVSFGQTSWIADINYLHGTAAVAPFDGDYGVVGFNFVYVDYGEFTKTVRATNDQGYLDIGTYSPKAYAIGMGYAKDLSDKFSVGGNVKFVRQELGTNVVGLADDGSYIEKDFATDVFAFDFGIIYKTGFKSLTLGMSVRNFSEELQYEEEGFQLPLNFKIGLSMNMFDLLEMKGFDQDFLLTVDASHPRDYPERIHVGGEYVFENTIALRAGYITPTDEGGFTLGFGAMTSFIGVDYCYAPFGVFDDVHRISMHFNW